MKAIRTLGLIANLTRPRAREGLAALLQAAEAAGITLLPAPETAAAMPGCLACAPADFAAAGAQGVISLGGDGSLLAAARAVAGSGLPLAGLNVGRLGYLTAVNEEGFGDFLRRLAAGDYTLEARTTLSAGRVGAQTHFPDALNDVVIARAEGGHAFALLLTLDGFPVARYLCDGLILSTPTGSTAYSLSVGGPVVAPTAQALLISVIAPHTLSARPLVVPRESHIEVRVDEAEGAPAKVYADGIAVAELRPGDAIQAAAAPQPVQFILPAHHNPYEPLSNKLAWSASFRR